MTWNNNGRERKEGMLQDDHVEVTMLLANRKTAAAAGKKKAPPPSCSSSALRAVWRKHEASAVARLAAESSSAVDAYAEFLEHSLEAAILKFVEQSKVKRD